MERLTSHYTLWVLLLSTLFVLPLAAQTPAPEPSKYAFAFDLTTASKYIWRGQRLTNDWSLQPSGTLSVGNFSFNVWGTLDLAAVNEGDSLFLPQNPAAPPGEHSGLKGKFSEVDYTLSYAIGTGPVSFDVGSIIYTFPERSASLPTTVELYGGVSFSELPLAPSATLYVDVDETRDAGDTGLYFQLAAEHSLLLRHARFPALNLSASLAFANSGFANYYYGASASGLHDFNFTISAPITLGERWGASAFLSYSALLGDFRSFQFQDLRDVYRGTAGSPATYADTVWGGVSLNLGF